jgi:uncharacterized membrane protein
MVMIHIFAAVVALLAGFLAVFLRKGSGWHGAAGNVFFVSMIVMTSSGAIMAGFLRPNALNLLVSLLTFYLVTTAWQAARRRDGGSRLFDSAALVFVLCVVAMAIAFAIQAANSPKFTKDGMPGAAYVVFGAIAFLCAVTDVRMLVRGGVSGSQRIARHLWRMSLSLLIATLSFFPGQARQLPQWLRESSFMYVPHILLIGSMIFWMYRVKLRKRVARDKVIPEKPHRGTPVSSPAPWARQSPRDLYEGMLRGERV